MAISRFDARLGVVPFRSNQYEWVTVLYIRVQNNKDSTVVDRHYCSCRADTEPLVRPACPGPLGTDPGMAEHAATPFR